MITGDDILIEYVSRLVRTLNTSNEDMVGENQSERMEKFVTHYVWHQPDVLSSQQDKNQNSQMHM